MHKMEFFEIIEAALAHKKGIEVSIRLPNLPVHEVIYNAAENVPMKAMYYADAYDDSMRLINNKEVRIISVKLR